MKFFIQFNNYLTHSRGEGIVRSGFEAQLHTYYTSTVTVITEYLCKPTLRELSEVTWKTALNGSQLHK